MNQPLFYSKQHPFIQHNKPIQNVLFKNVRNSKQGLQLCRLGTYFRNQNNAAFPSSSSIMSSTQGKSIRILSNEEKDSASRSLILFGKVKFNFLKKDTDIVGKVFFSTQSKNDDNSLIIEALVYEYIVTTLMYYHVTPHLVEFVAYGDVDVKQCRGSNDAVLKTLIQQGRGAMPQSKTQKYNLDHIHVLFIRRNFGKKLSQLSRAGNQSSWHLDWNDWLSILFQILYTLQCFDEIGFMHNDLHTSNIFVEKLRKPITLIYYVGNTRACYRLYTKYIVRIYDFDFASFTFDKLKKTLNLSSFPRSFPKMNTKLRKGEYFCQHGICHTVHWYTDLFRVMSGLALHTKVPGLKNWIYKYINPSVINDPTLRRYGIMCRKRPHAKDKCDVLQPKPNDFTYPIDIIRRAFSKFRYSGIKTSKTLERYQPYVYATPRSRIGNTVVSRTHSGNNGQVIWNQLKK